ncbi:hypothetical protein AURDEDRAFT_173017 [Auricularia subglabra TFB-10046 SS5]|uniref:Uncharacterized protein n=1 Tax=Auricularia subglabra (strain TFB-10046 / SS5) TaxID=717982 RepID=J0LHY4_AURST|nr:hypothetical protein AURDEDRAFT_173017 [Auricularia subglabra TFB-10046 SS5]
MKAEHWQALTVIAEHFGVGLVGSRLENGILSTANAAQQALWANSEQKIFRDAEWAFRDDGGRVTSDIKRRPTVALEVDKNTTRYLRTATHPPAGVDTFMADVQNASKTASGAAGQTHCILDEQAPCSPLGQPWMSGGNNMSITVSTLVDVLQRMGKGKASDILKKNIYQIISNLSQKHLLWVSNNAWLFGPAVQAIAGVYIRRENDPGDESEGWWKWVQMFLELLVRFGTGCAIHAALMALLPPLVPFAWLFSSAANCAVTFLWPSLRRGASSAWGWVKSF